MVGGEGVEGEQVLLGLLEQRRHLGQRLAQPLERVADELACCISRLGVEERAEQRRDHPLLVFPKVAERLAQEVDTAALPGTAEHLRDRIGLTICGALDNEGHPERSRQFHAAGDDGAAASSR